MNKVYLLPILLVFTALTATLFGAKTNLENPYSSEYVIVSDTIPLNDRQDDFLNDSSRNPFDLSDPASVEQTVEYDPETNSYIITEKIGEGFFRAPTYMTFEEYMAYREQQDQQRYFDILQGKEFGDEKSGLRDPISDIDVENTLLDRLFGGTEVDIRPQGNIDLTFGVDFQNVQNPALTPRQQRQGGFDFDMAIQMNVEGQIGEKLNLGVNYNTQATFDFDNQLNLNYDTGEFSKDEIIKNIEAGNVSLPLRSQLITGAQSLFGLKTELQFGRLRLTALASQQKSEQETINIQGGSQEQMFEVRADDYDENRHFFLSHYNRNHFEEALENLPQVKSLFKLNRIEVYITNDIAESENIREIVAITDLGEGLRSRITNDEPAVQPPLMPVNPAIDGSPLPANNANPIYNLLTSNPDNAQTDRVSQVLSRPPYNMQQGQDFERLSARILSPSQYTVNEDLGFVSINVNVQPDQVVAVSYLYTYNGKEYQVGQFATDQPTTGDDATETRVLYTRMLKSTIQQISPTPDPNDPPLGPNDPVPTLPLWDLMMKNIYPTGAFQADPSEFYLDIYYENPLGTVTPYLPDTRLAEKRLLNVFNLDDLNQLGDPMADGIFDFVPGITINPRNGRMMFPRLEPFGSDLARQIDNPVEERIYTFPELYTNSKVVAREYAERNRFIIRGRYKSAVSSEISLGSFNIPANSETVTAGGRVLTRGVDYEIDYGIGKLRILNDAILASGANISVNFEDNSLFGFQQKSMVGLRADYTFNKNLAIGATYLHLFERPYTPKVNAGDDPLNNRIVGVDVNYSAEAPWVTKLADKLPFYSTKEVSTFTLQAEAAGLKPGHSKAINEGRRRDSRDSIPILANPDRDGGVVYIDDFEGATSELDLRQSPNRWKLASTPQHQPIVWPEGELLNDREYGMNRAKLAWYRIQDNNISGDNPYETIVSNQEIFPNLSPQVLGGGTNVNRAFTFNLDYYPDEIGPYNYDPAVPGTGFTAGTTIANGELQLAAPETRWGGIMSSLQNNDFQAANYEFIEFWMLSPYLDEQGNGGAAPNADNNPGEIIIHLGSVSEDILRDSRKFYENGLPDPNLSREAPTVFTNWGRVPVQQQITASFDADPAVRNVQDVGLDGLDDAGEAAFFAEYLASLPAGATVNDPSHDNFVSFRAEGSENLSVFERYKDQSNPEGNSESAAGNISTAGDQQPDTEDLNRDFTLNETESYFEYRIPIEHDGAGGIEMNNPYLTGDVRDEGEAAANGRKWYRFKIPLDQDVDRTMPEGERFFDKYNGIQNFRSIRFMRMIVKDFKEETHLRFARLDLVRNQWRRLIDRPGADDPIPTLELGLGDQTTFDVNEVNVEENDQKLPFNYVLPPGISREQAVNAGINAAQLQNEKSLALEVCNLEDGTAEVIYRNTSYDMRFYEGIKMFIHAEREEKSVSLEDGDLTAFIRVGSDFTNNYYEYELPLTFSDEDTGLTSEDFGYDRIVWPEENDVNIDFEILRQLKRQRNGDPEAIFDKVYPAPNNTPVGPRGEQYRIRGNPNLGDVKTVLIGIRNPSRDYTQNPDDDGLAHCAEIWVNEMRLFGLDESGGYAALARADLGVADLGTASLALQYSSQGFGSLDQTLLERSREEIFKADWSFNVSGGKFFPEQSGIKIPFYYQESKEYKTPQFDPYDRDIELETKISDAETPEEKEIIREQAIEVTEIRSINFTNVRKERTNTEKKPMPWDVSNFSVSASKTTTTHRDPIIEEFEQESYRGALDYTYSIRSKPIKPFKKISKSKWLKLITEFNFNPLPSNFGFSSVMDRDIGKTKYRFAGNDPLFNTFFQKRWTWDRSYNLNWDFAKNIKFNFNAVSTSVIDEAPIEVLESREMSELYRGKIDTDLERELIWDNIRNLGRDKNYTHNAGVDVTAPLKLIPILDWMNIKGSYDAGYTWSASALSIQDSLGNVIQNRQRRELTADLDFTKLYKKSAYLKRIEDGDRKKRNNNPRSRSSRDGEAKRKTSEDDKKKDKKDKKDKELSTLEKVVIRPLLMLRKVRGSYSETFGTTIPGFMQDNPEYLGLSDNFTQPGWKFVGGWQPNLSQEAYYGSDDYLYNNYQQISASIWQNNQVQQLYTREWDARVNVEPFKDFKVDLDIESRYTENHTEFFKRDTIFPGTVNPAFNATQEEYRHLAPNQAGSYTISFFALNTFHRVSDTLEQQRLFSEFLDNRSIIADRLGGTQSDHADSLNRALGYPKGFGQDNPDVFIPAFLAAYTGKSPTNVKLNVFNLLPKLNWRLNYSGLGKLPVFKKYFKSFKLTHGYKSTLTVNSFQTDLRYDFENTTQLSENQNFFSRFQIPEIVITEQFSPLLGVDARLNNEMSIRVDYKRARALALSSQAYTINYTNSEEFTVGFGYKLKEVDIPFLTGSKKKKKKKKAEEKDDKPAPRGGTRSRRGGGGSAEPGDLDLNFDFSFRDDVTEIQNFDAESAPQPTRGSTTIRISPSAEYRINKQLSLRLFFDYNSNDPKTTQGFKITNTQGGVMVRFTLQ